MPTPSAEPNTPAPAWIGLGANLGDAAATIEAALAALGSLPGTRLLRRSSLWASAPVDAVGPDFVNAVALLQSTLSAHELLAALQAIELQHGRERPYRNAPRTLDLDLLLYADLQLTTPKLTLPHPRLHERAFVLAPMAEIDPDLIVPAHGPVRRLLAAVAPQSVRRIPDTPLESRRARTGAEEDTP